MWRDSIGKVDQEPHRIMTDKHTPDSEETKIPGLDADDLAALEQLVEDHEEEVLEGGKTVRRRGVYLLPNLFTTGALFAA